MPTLAQLEASHEALVAEVRVLREVARAAKALSVHTKLWLPWHPEASTFTEAAAKDIEVLHAKLEAWVDPARPASPVDRCRNCGHDRFRECVPKDVKSEAETPRFVCASCGTEVDPARPAPEETPGCAACDGDPEAHGLHVCGKEPFA